MRVEVGDAAISGRVVTGEPRRAVADVMVTLQSPIGTAQLVAQSDSDGRYAFEGIAPGLYRLSTTHRDYVRACFGGCDGEVDTPLNDRLVTVAGGQHRTGVDFVLTRGASISGRVTGPEGQPLSKAHVGATLATTDSRFRLVGGPITTNDRGEYVIRNLPEGQYSLSVSWVDPDAVRGGADSARPVYYPGTTNAAERLSIPVATAAAVTDADIAFPASELIRITGQVVRSVAEGTVQAQLIAPWTTLDVPVAADGRFSTPRVRGGRYTLVARARGGDVQEAAWLAVDLTFPLEDIVLGLMATGSITGRVTTDDGEALPEGFEVAAAFADDGKDIDHLKRDRSGVGDGGTFELRGLFGPRLLRLVGVTDGWRIKSVTVGKTAATPLFDVAPGSDTRDVTIVLTRQ